MTYPTNEQLDEALENGRKLAGPPPARELMINIKTIRPTGPSDLVASGYQARADLDNEEEKAKAIEGAKAFLDEL